MSEPLIAELEKCIANMERDINECDKIYIHISNVKALVDQLNRTQSKNESLTLDELKQMDGEPVYIVEYPDWGHWELSEDAEDYLCDRDPDFYGMTHNDPAGKYGLHTLGWLAYRNKPEQEGAE